MSIEAEIVVTLAEVEVADDYRIALTLREPMVPFTHTEAEQLAQELLDAVAEAKAMLIADFPVPNLSHGFDLAPVCRDCMEGKHSACIGSAFVEREQDIDEVECGCHGAGHQMIGDAG